MIDWPRVSAILERGLELPSHERDAFFIQEAGGDTELLVELRSLARSHDRAEWISFIEAPLAAAQPDLVLNTLHPGQRISSYEIVEEAGRGGMGIVYRARDTRLGRDVAVKCIAEGASASHKARLESEARLAARISHPAVATVHALEERDGQLFLVSEFVEGQTLRQRLDRGALPASDTIRIAHAMAEGLAAAHRQHVAHGDLKPENVIVRPDGQVKILDFGLGETRTETTPVAPSVLAGTPGYMAPEQLRGAPPDPRVDVFAFGVVLFEMATGRHPFAGDRGSMLEAALSSRAAYDDPALPPSLAPIVRRCLAPNPDERYPSAQQIVDALDSTAPAAHALPAPGRGLGWFIFHQRIVSVLAAAMPFIVWFARTDINGRLDRPWGSVFFLLTLAGATAVVAIRLNADFIARECPAELADHLRANQRRLWLSELSLDACVLILGAVLADRTDFTAGILFACGIASLISLLVIEPATVKGALRS